MQQNKVATLKIAFKQLSDTIISQSEVPSYRKTIGRPTKRRGYVDGMILHDGKVTTGVGGGLCQLSNSLYWMTLHSLLSVIEHYRHSYDAPLTLAKINYSEATSHVLTII